MIAKWKYEILIYVIVNLLIIFFVASFIPPLREYFKKDIKKFYIYVGVMILIVDLIMDFFVAPKMINLYKEAKLDLNYDNLYINLILGTILSLFLIVFGIKYNGFTKSNLRFYLFFVLFIVVISINLQLVVDSIILPIYKLTDSIK